MLLLVLLIMFCSMIGTVFLIGLCGSLSVAHIPPVPPRDDPPSIVMEEPVREDLDTNANFEYNVYGENIGEDNNNIGSKSGKSTGEDPIKADFRERIASRSVPILRSRGMTDEEIKSELLRDFSLTEEQAEEILATQ